jgi:hypothetical protein
VGVVQIEHRVVLARQSGELGQPRRVAGHAVDPVHADHPRALGVPPQQPRQRLRVVVGEAQQGRAVRAGDHRAVVDRLVGAGVQEDRPLVGQHRDDRSVDVGEGRQQQAVLGPEQLGEPDLDLLVQDGAAEHARPARMGAPPLQVGRDGLQHVLVQVQPEVVAGGEVDQPMAADPDAAPAYLVDHGVDQRVAGVQVGQVGAGGQPARQPASRRLRRPGRARQVRLP